MPQRDSLMGTVLVALVLCVICSLGVSAAAVLLRPLQEQNKVLDRQRNILDATGIAYSETGKNASELSKQQVQEYYSVIEEKLVDLETGKYTTEVDKETYEPQTAIKSGDPELVVPIEEPEYRIGFSQRERISRVYLVKDFNDPTVIRQVVLPVYGKGLWSTLYGYLALKRDLETVQGLTFYEHGETPGLGGEVDNTNWKAQWVGREVFGEEGKPKLGVSKGPAPEEDPYLVDGLSGATITSNGVTNLVRYWVSDSAFGPYLDNLEQEFESGQPVPTVGGSQGDSDVASATDEEPPVVNRKAPDNNASTE